MKMPEIGVIAAFLRFVSAIAAFAASVIPLFRKDDGTGAGEPK